MIKNKLEDLPREVVILDEAINILPLDRIESPELLSIAEVWLELPREGNRGLPRWSSFSPAMIAPQLSKMCVLRVGTENVDDIEFSLYGGHPTQHIGNGRPLVMQDLRVDPLRKNNYVDIRDRAGRAIENAAPQFARKTLSWDGCPDVEYEVMMLPFVSEEGTSRVMQPLASQARPPSGQVTSVY